MEQWNKSNKGIAPPLARGEDAVWKVSWNFVE